MDNSFGWKFSKCLPGMFRIFPWVLAMPTVLRFRMIPNSLNGTNAISAPCKSRSLIVYLFRKMRNYSTIFCKWAFFLQETFCVILHNVKNYETNLNPLKLKFGEIESMLSLSFSFRTRSKSSNIARGSLRSLLAERSIDSKLFSRPRNARGSIFSIWQCDRSRWRICDSLLIKKKDLIFNLLSTINSTI